MATTRMRVNSNATVFHRVAGANDMQQHDIGTSDSAVSGLGGSADFQIDSDENTTYSTAHKQQGESEGAIGSGAISQFIHIKNTGFQEASKTNTTTSNLTVGIGGTFASAGGFTLASGEAITLHGLGGGSDNLSEIQLDSSSGNIYVEVVYL